MKPWGDMTEAERDEYAAAVAKRTRLEQGLPATLQEGPAMAVLTGLIARSGAEAGQVAA